jgi:hypothetical protein
MGSRDVDGSGTMGAINSATCSNSSDTEERPELRRVMKSYLGKGLGKGKYVNATPGSMFQRTAIAVNRKGLMGAMKLLSTGIRGTELRCC